MAVAAGAAADESRSRIRENLASPSPPLWPVVCLIWWDDVHAACKAFNGVRDDCGIGRTNFNRSIQRDQLGARGLVNLVDKPGNELTEGFAFDDTRHRSQESNAHRGPEFSRSMRTEKAEQWHSANAAKRKPGRREWQLVQNWMCRTVRRPRVLALAAEHRGNLKMPVDHDRQRRLLHCGSLDRAYEDAAFDATHDSSSRGEHRYPASHQTQAEQSSLPS